MAATSRAWVFTWNNPPEDAYAQFEARRSQIHCINIGREVGATGTPHLQGHLVMRTSCRLASLVRMFPGVHFEPRRGSEQQAREYTEKEGHPDRLDWDDRSQGSRSDLAAVAALVAVNPRVGVRAVAAQMPTSYMKYHAGVAALSRALLPRPPQHLVRHVSWFFGPTGTGKSFSAMSAAAALADESNIFRWTIHNLKFCGEYAGQQYVIIDELRSNWEHFTFARLLTLLDAYQCEVEVKGGQVPWCATHVWITTPLHPADFVTDDERRGNPQAVAQLTRRITNISHFADVYVPPSPVLAPPCPPTPPVTPALLPFPCVDSSDGVALVLPRRVPVSMFDLQHAEFSVTDSDSDTPTQRVRAFVSDR